MTLRRWVIAGLITGCRIDGLDGSGVGPFLPGRHSTLLIYNSSTGGIDDAEIGVTAVLPDGTDVDLHPDHCGAGCFTQQFDFQPGVTTMVTADSKDWTRGNVTLDLPWPPPVRQPEQLDEVIAAMRQVEELTLIETVNYGPGAEATSSATISGDAFKTSRCTPTPTWPTSPFALEAEDSRSICPAPAS